MKQSTSAIDPFFEELYPSLKTHLLWYYNTQVRSDDPYAFYWRGRTLTHALASGLDDYPRAPWLSEQEGHVDLHSWMTFMFQVMGRIAHHLGKEEDHGQFNEMAGQLLQALEEKHWDSSKNMFVDYAVHPNTSELHKFPNFGYISLLPLALKLIPADSPKLNAVLDSLEDPDRVWSNYGILSLSKKNRHFGTGENYWRGPIWINVNYLILDGLKHYGQHNQKAQILYHRLKDNLVENIFNEYQRTGYLFEQYNPITGEGQRSKPFTGWTSLVVMMLSELF
jgi:mannosyl-oligosaccharide glucosidase